jgi:hypothetical protein
MILKSERLWTVCANAKDKETRTTPATTTSGRGCEEEHKQELEAMQAENESMKSRLETERNDYVHQLLQLSREGGRRKKRAGLRTPATCSHSRAQQWTVRREPIDGPARIGLGPCSKTKPECLPLVLVNLRRVWKGISGATIYIIPYISSKLTSSLG